MASNSESEPIPDDIEYQSMTTDFHELQPVFHTLPSNFSQTMSSSNLPAFIDNAILRQSIPYEQSQPKHNALVQNGTQMNSDQSATVTPVLHSQNVNTQQIQATSSKSTKIEIISQPRKKFRPRTQNESKNSSHYLRCADGDKNEHPTIHVPRQWAQQSNTNIVEVTLVDLDGQPHPYTLDNKSSQFGLDEKAPIFKQNDCNTLYFRLSNEDFSRGYKTLMIELIKSKQDDVITKKLIQSRKLDQSMLRFTRIYRDPQGDYKEDRNSVEYSTVMIEDYGDVSVEQMGPTYGPMSGQQTIFVVTKGRFTKKDITITISEPKTAWTVRIEQFSMNSNFIYFSMPNFSHPEMIRAEATITIYYKEDKIHEAIYLYTSLLDQELTESRSHATASPNVNQVQFEMLNLQSPPSRRLSKTKATKRLDNK